MSPPSVWIVTLNWNRGEDTLACLETLMQLTYPNTNLLVVDNGSTDGSPSMIAVRYPTVRQIVNPENFGFARGFNIGLKWALDAGADFVLVLNNDTLAAPDMLEPLVAAAGPTRVGITAPVIFYAAAPTRIWSAGAGRSRWTLDLTGHHRRSMPLVANVEREFVSGCAMLIKRVVLEQVGLFDERFFMYYEDSDYCLRVRQAGFSLWVVPGARLWHKVSVSSEGSDSPAERFSMAYSSMLFYRKHVSGWRWLLVAPWRFGSALKTTLRLLGAGRLRSAQAYWHGLWQGVRGGRLRA